MQTLNLAYFVVWFLLPIIPAFIFFKFMPNNAIVNGPFRGLKINLGGAFAGYFLLFIILLPIMARLIKVEEEIYVVWKIHGKILDEHNNKIKASSNPTITLIPSTQVKNGEFNMDVIGTRQQNGLIQFPFITIGADKFVSDNLEQLDYIDDHKSVIKKGNWEMDPVHRIATLKTGFTLKVDSTININTPITYVQADK